MGAGLGVGVQGEWFPTAPLSETTGGAGAALASGCWEVLLFNSLTLSGAHFGGCPLSARPTDPRTSGPSIWSKAGDLPSGDQLGRQANVRGSRCVHFVKTLMNHPPCFTEAETRVQEGQHVARRVSGG